MKRQGVFIRHVTAIRFEKKINFKVIIMSAVVYNVQRLFLSPRVKLSLMEQMLSSLRKQGPIENCYKNVWYSISAHSLLQYSPSMNVYLDQKLKHYAQRINWASVNHN